MSGPAGGAAPDYALLDRAGAAQLIFHPRPDPGPPPPGASDHAIEVASGVAVAARHYESGEADATILYFHGNGEVMGDHDGIARFYHEIGFDLFVAEFRGYGKSGGRPSVAALAADALPAARYAAALLDGRGRAARLFVMGRSLGSQPALEVAARASGLVRGLIVESGAATVRRLAARYGLAGDAAADALADAHEAKIRSIRLPALLIHGERDELVPLDQAAGLHDLLEGARRELVVIPGAGHNDILWIGRRRYFEAIRGFVDAAG